MLPATGQASFSGSAIPRPDYPRPQFERQEWLNLNGEWNFDFDDEDVGLVEKWPLGHHYRKKIVVPFCFESRLSGIEDTHFHDVVWYERHFTLPRPWSGKRIVLHFGAVDYRATIWVNGAFVAFHEGGHTPFRAEITHAVQPGDNEIVVRVEDLATDLQQPRGKQFWEEKSRSIYYTRTTGIWQTVWIEALGPTFLESIRVTPDVDAGAVTIDYVVDRGFARQQMEIEISLGGRIVATDVSPVQVTQRQAHRQIALRDFDAACLWSPEHPVLYDLVLRISEQGHILDEVESYFGMRRIAVEDGKVMLNSEPLYMKLVLDQGYFPTGQLTAPSDDDLKRDVELAREMGFNGVRKHQKIEDPRYLYWADRLGLLVWEEMPSRHTFTPQSISRITAEWQEAIDRDYNHPCIIAWVSMNESWGTPRLATEARQRHHLQSLYHLVKSLDLTRFVISNDGWEHADSDLFTIHDYDWDPGLLRERYGSLAGIMDYTPGDRMLHAPSFQYRGEPIILSECGGIAFRKSEWEGWGYSEAKSDSAFAEQYASIIRILQQSPMLQGYCYTELTDVEQEINGLLTYDRRPKIDLAIIRRINEGS